MSITNLWGPEPNFKLFISHKSEIKSEATKLKENLKQFNISCFVAHEDIEPVALWQEEIENALFSADALVALMTDKYSDSCWTDQEIGIAYARKIPIIPVRMGRDPYGFIAKIQALTCNLDDEFNLIISLLLKNSSRMVDIYIELVNNSPNFNESNYLSTYLKDINSLSTEQIDRIINAFQNNSQVNSSYGFQGNKQYNGEKFSEGLKNELFRITGNDYSKELELNK